MDSTNRTAINDHSFFDILLLHLEFWNVY